MIKYVKKTFAYPIAFISLCWGITNLFRIAPSFNKNILNQSSKVYCILNFCCLTVYPVLMSQSQHAPDLECTSEKPTDTQPRLVQILNNLHYKIFLEKSVNMTEYN